MPGTRFPSAAHRLPLRIGLPIAAGALFASIAGAQDLELLSFRDSLVVRQIWYRAPCPEPPPMAWSRRDSRLGSGWRCSLVETAARAIRSFQELRPPLRGPADPWNPLCVRIVVGRNTGSTGLPGDWLVIFDLAPDQPAYVLIDRQNGTIGTVAVSYGPPGDMPKCLGG